ncbi:unnamed protein product [Penicillium olsonii]|nr:unnamed protein product [Penicillium olsonii]CAG7929755.1 unnamed protein product [Penicillium olsonii]
MSLNKSPYPLSSSSSRQSLQKEASRPDTALSRPGDKHPRGQLPEIRSGNETNQLPVSVASPCEDAALNGTEEHYEESPDQLSSQPAFQPFFTLIEDAHTSDYYHPTVHYIFSDDDSDIVTEAALRSLSAQQEALSDSQKEHIAHNNASPHDEAKDPSESAPSKTTLLPPPVPGMRENFIILDVEPSPATEAQDPVLEQLVPGKNDTKSLSSSPANQPSLPQESQRQYRVTGAQSFSSTWQVLNTEIVPAPTFENSKPGESPEHGLMLKIRGTRGLPEQKLKGGEDRGGQRLEDMMDQFAKRMSELQVVIDAAGASNSNTHMHGELEHPLSPDAVNEAAQDVIAGMEQI